MLEVLNFSLMLGGHTLYEQASFTLYTGQKYALVGKNGSGKTSLLKAILGSIPIDGGDVVYNKSCVIATIEQECDNFDQKCIDYVISGYPVLGSLWTEMKSIEGSDNYERVAEICSKIDDLNGFDIEAKAANILHGLGFSQSDLQRTLSEFSGGWVMRLNLAKCLLIPSDILLLDEPTNHLDLDTILWLEKWLKQYQGSLLLISHDRTFLDRVVDNIVAIENNKLTTYKGNYSQYEQIKYAIEQQKISAYNKLSKERERIMGFVRKFKAKATKAKQAQSRLKSLERMPVIEKVISEYGYNFEFFEPKEKLGYPAIKLENLSFGYTEQKTILKNIHLSLEPDLKVGILGFNGAGKSTLIKILAGALKCSSGTCLHSQSARIGYFAQHQVESLDLEESPLWHLEKIASGHSLTALRSYLGRFCFSEDKVLEKVKYFSGGEKARLALALLIWSKPNILLLDEPTNHLDLQIRQALSLALQSFKGLLVVVSHDRSLLESIVNQFYLVHDNKVTEYDGTLEDYEKWSIEQKRQVEKVDEKSQTAEHNKTFREKQKKLDRIERKIDKTQNLIDSIDTKMHVIAPSEIEELISLQQEKDTLLKTLSTLEEQWLDESS